MHVLPPLCCSFTRVELSWVSCARLPVDSSTFLWLFPLSWSKPTAAGATAEDRMFSVFSWLVWPWLEIITEKTCGSETKLTSSENGTNLLFSELSKIRREACVLECVAPNTLYSPLIIPLLHLLSPHHLRRCVLIPTGLLFSACFFSLLSFSFPLSSFIALRWAEDPDLRLLGQERLTCAAAGVLQSNPTSFGPSISAQLHLPPVSLFLNNKWILA